MSTTESTTENVPRRLHRLAEALAEEFVGKSRGHCVRVDHLSLDDAAEVCLELRDIGVTGMDAYLLDHSRHDSLRVPADYAIELRNRKENSLCLFVPAHLQDAAVSSLGNSFSPYDLPAFFRRLRAELRQELPRALGPSVDAALRQLRGGARVPQEDEIAFLSAVLDAPSAESVGANLWRIGLIPDLVADEELSPRRLELNRQSVDRLARPTRPYASLGERIASLRLAPNTIQTDLGQYLIGKRLQSDREWLRLLLSPEWRGRLTFEMWEFPAVEPSNLSAIEVQPFYEGGVLKAGTGLKQAAPGTPPQANCGPKQTVTVRWQPIPAKPTDVARWRVEIIPDRERYDAGTALGLDLPPTTVRGNVRSAKVSLDFNPNDLAVQSVQLRVVALDANDVEIADGESLEATEGLSQPFYLENAVGDDDEARVRRLPVERSLPDALLSFALNSQEPDLQVTPLKAEEKDALYYPFLINDRAVVRVSTTPFLQELQAQILRNLHQGGRYRASVSGIDALTLRHTTADPLPIHESIGPAWERFAKDRKQAFEAVRDQERHGRGLVETADLSASLCRAVRAYAKSYQELLDAAWDASAAGGDVDVASLLALDTLRLDFGAASRLRHATVVLPTHPLRLLWYVAYGEWLNKVTRELLAMPQRRRSSAFNTALLQHVAPVNLPAFLVGKGGSDAQLFAENLGLFHGVLIPLDAQDPGALLTEVARVLGFPSFTSEVTDLTPKQAAAEIASYLELHPYLGTLRVNAINPGSGEFVRRTLEAALSVPADEEDASPLSRLRLDLLTHTEQDVQTPAEGLDRLTRGWYHGGTHQRGEHLHPGIQVARRLLTPEALDQLPGGDVHLSLCLDHYQTRMAAVEDGQTTARGTSAALFGLLTRFVSTFSSQERAALWTRMVRFNGSQVAERHPVSRAYSDLLVDGQEAYLRLLAHLLPGAADGPAAARLPALSLAVGPDEQRQVGVLHQQSDWVLTIDRHFGLEYYDSPRDTHLSGHADQFLLDYAPEFLDGLGHRLIVTTQWKEEIADILGRAMDDLGLARDDVSTADMLRNLKMISGRLALRLVDEGSLAKETVSLAVVANFLLRRGDLQDTIIIPLDAHRRLFSDAKRSQATDTERRCDLILVRPSRTRLTFEYVEVKYRVGNDPLSPALLDQIADQTLATDKMFRSVFFSDPPRQDAPILRSQFASILRFYAERAYRHGRLTDEAQYAEMLDNIARVEMGPSKLVSRYTGFVVNLHGEPRRPLKHREVVVHTLTDLDVERSTDFHLSGGRSLQDVAPSVDGAPRGAVPSDGPTPPGRSTLPDGPTPGGEALSVPSTVGETEAVGNAAPPLPRPARDAVREEEPGSAPGADPRVVSVPLGLSVHTDAEVVWRGGVTGSPHLFVLGIPGQGKSWSLLRLLAETAERGIASLILDFHGQFRTDLAVGPDLPQPQIIDAARGLPFSPFEVGSGADGGTERWRINSFQVAEIVQYVCGLGDMQRDLVYEAVNDAYVAVGSGGEDGGAPLPTMAMVYDRLKAIEAGRRSVKNTVARCRPLFEFSLFRDKSAEGASFADFLGQTTIVDVHGLGLETLQLAAGAFLLRKLYKDMFTWGESDRIRLLVVLDEAHRLAKDVTLPKLMKEGRKFGVAVVVASQSMTDFHPDVLQNAGTKVVFRTNFPSSKRVAGYFKRPHYIPDLVGKLEGLEVGHAVVQSPEMPVCAEVAMHPYRGREE